jgi:stage III sporulation protein AD
MDIFKICAIGIIAAALAVTVKQYKPEIALLISAGAAVIILFIVSDYIFAAVNALFSLSDKAGVKSELLSCVLKIIGVGYIAEFSSSVCEDSGNKSIGDKITFAAKIIILIVALPMLTAVIDLISQIVA